MDEALLKQAKRHLRRVDPVMRGLIDAHGPFSFNTRRTNHFHALVRTIINQQLSVKAGQTIEARLLATQGGRAFNALKMTALTDKAMRSCGLSQNKARYIRGITDAVVDKELRFTHLSKQDDETVMAALMTYPGVGRWSAEIFLMSSFARPDVLPVGDLVIRKSMQRYYGVDADASFDSYVEVAEMWRPFRSVASRYLWGAT